MTIAPKDRVRASRLRARDREGVKPLTEAERAWLADYDRAGPPRAPVVDVAPAAPLLPTVSTVLEPSSPVSGAASDHAAAPIPVPRSLDAPSTALVAPGSAGKCPPNCPECAKARGEVKGAFVCATTGRTVYPPVSIEAAKSIAALILGALSFASRFFRADKTSVKPLPSEIDLLAKGVREVLTRRTPGVAQVDDILAAGWGLGAYVTRAATAPSAEPSK